MRTILFGLLSLVTSLALIPTALAASITDSGSEAASETTSGLTAFFSTMVNRAPSWIAAMIVFACSFIVARMVKEKVLDRISSQFEDEDILVLIGRITYAGVLGLGVTIALSIAGIDLTTIIAAIGFGVGFAMQDLIMNFMAGVMILLNRQFVIGDFIKINETIGQVTEIQSRATILKALDGTRVIVPNSDLFTNQVTSFTSNPFRRIEVPVGVEYRTDLSQAHQAILEALQDHQGVLQDPNPAIVLDQFADSSINFLVRFWVDSHSNWVQIRSDVIQLIKKHLDAESIGIPFPIRTLVFDKDTEDVMMPVYQVPEKDAEQHQAKRSSEEADLAAAVVSAHARAQKIQDIQPMTEIDSIETVEVAEEGGALSHVEEGGVTTTKVGFEAVESEDVAAVSAASQAVQADQEASAPLQTENISHSPPSAPESEQVETGANFLQAQSE